MLDFTSAFDIGSSAMEGNGQPIDVAPSFTSGMIS